jgi:hypothetical protein
MLAASWSLLSWCHLLSDSPPLQQTTAMTSSNNTSWLSTCEAASFVAISDQPVWLLLPLLHLASGIPTVATDQPR